MRNATDFCYGTENCDFWPECSHVLAAIETVTPEQLARAEIARLREALERIAASVNPWDACDHAADAALALTVDVDPWETTHKRPTWSGE